MAGELGMKGLFLQRMTPFFREFRKWCGDSGDDSFRSCFVMRCVLNKQKTAIRFPAFGFDSH